MIFLYVLAGIGALLGAVALMLTAVFSTGAPQQAAGAATAVALAVLPYVFARAVQIVSQDGAQKRHNKQLLEKLDKLAAAMSAARAAGGVDR